jgi:hypothetical protein
MPIVDRGFISGLLSSVRGRLPMRQIIQDSQHERTKNNQ